jgi:endonuclease/exonuclease/phosphatase family metal-dependent hydrolase
MLDRKFLRWIPRLLVVLSGWLASCHHAPVPAAMPTAEPFVALSWNVRYGTANDGLDAWPLRRDELVAQIRAAEPAILGVQEALADQLDFLAAALPGFAVVGTGREGGRAGEHAALLVDQSRFEILRHGDFWLSATPERVASVGWDAALPRICTFAELRDRRDGQLLCVWNTHFDHRGAVARRRSAELLAARIAATQGPHLVLGDFNAGEASDVLQVLRAAGLVDSFRACHPAASAVGTFHAFRGGTAGDKIDYVLAGAGLAIESAAHLTAAGPRGRWPSDHHGVVASLRRSGQNRVRTP